MKETVNNKRLYDHSLTEIEEPAAKAGPPSAGSDTDAVGQPTTAGSPGDTMPPGIGDGKQGPGDDAAFAVPRRTSSMPTWT